MTVRIATQKDEAQLMLLCRALNEDNAMFAMNDDMVLNMLRRAFNRNGIIGVIDGANELAAAIYIQFSHFWYSTDIFLEELFNFVRPSYRGSDYARQMLDFAKNCQKTLGLPLVTGIVTNKRAEAKVRLYRQKLGAPAGAFFVVGGHWENENVEPCEDLWVRKSHGRDKKKVIKQLIGPGTVTTMPLPMMAMTNGGGK